MSHHTRESDMTLWLMTSLMIGPFLSNCLSLSVDLKAALKMTMMNSAVGTHMAPSCHSLLLLLHLPSKKDFLIFLFSLIIAAVRRVIFSNVAVAPPANKDFLHDFLHSSRTESKRPDKDSCQRASCDLQWIHFLPTTDCNCDTD